MNLKELELEDHLDVHQKMNSYSEISQRFGVLCYLKTLNSKELKHRCKEYGEIYHDDVKAVKI